MGKARVVEKDRASAGGVLADVPGERFVAGAVTRPWEADVKLRALPPEEFATFDDPGYAKIVWTLEASALSAQQSVVRTRTLVKTTDATASAALSFLRDGYPPAAGAACEEVAIRTAVRRDVRGDPHAKGPKAGSRKQRGSKSTDSPSIPACTADAAVTSRDGVLHARPRAPALAPGGSRTRTPNRPLLSVRRVPGTSGRSTAYGLLDEQDGGMAVLVAQVVDHAQRRGRRGRRAHLVRDLEERPQLRLTVPLALNGPSRR